ETRAHPDGQAVGTTNVSTSTIVASHENPRLQGNISFSQGSRGEEIQAVHQSLSPTIPDGAGMSSLPWHQATARRAQCSRRRAEHRTSRRAARRSARDVAERAAAD